MAPEGLAGQPVVVGSGIAGLATALHLASEPVVLITKAPLGEAASSPWAQGGVAVGIGADDTADLHLADTLAAGDGLCDPAAARRILSQAAAAVDDLLRFGARFDRDTAGRLALGLEAAHSRRRILHAEGDGTGRELVRALREAVRRTPSITVLEHMEARRILTEDGAVTGLLVSGAAGTFVLPTGRVVLATGGVGGLFEATTNPVTSFGQGLALAARAGAVLRDMEFVQFHPTALAVGEGAEGALPLVSEAVRGEGARLVNDRCERFLEGTPGAELAPRDVVAAAVFREIQVGRRVFLDARSCLGARFASRFPGIDAMSRAAGLDPARDLLPICPAAHYHMGGALVDDAGRTTVPGLWAVGEVSSTGLHGANRLASNSLLEAVVCAREVAESVLAAPQEAARPRPLALVPPAPSPVLVRPLVSRHVGVERDGAGLAAVVAELLPLAEGAGTASDAALVALLMAVGAHQRQESRGAHRRADYSGRAAEAQHTLLTLDGALNAAHRLAAQSAPVALPV